MPFKIASRAAIKRLAALFVCLGLASGFGFWWMFALPGTSWAGDVEPFTEAEVTMATRLRATVEVLATDIGARNAFLPERYRAAEDWLAAELESIGYSVERQCFVAHLPENGIEGIRCANVIASCPGRTADILVIGAHYDSYAASPGANDNGSGTAAVLELARLAHGTTPEQTLRFVFFANEEPPMFQTDQMGSLVYAKRCKANNDPIAGMISIETIGVFIDAPGSQAYPAPLDRVYPDTGNFIGFVSNMRSRRFLHQLFARFRATTEIPTEGGALFGGLPGVGWSDHWSFWSCGYPALMITDTAPYRDPMYHTGGDTAGRLDYERMARIVNGLWAVLSARPIRPVGDASQS